MSAGQTRPVRRRGRRAAIATLVLLLIAAGVAALLLLSREERSGDAAVSYPSGGARLDVAAFQPFAFEPEEEEEFVRRGRDGLGHVVFAKSPGGVEATAARVERLEPMIEDAAERHDVDAETLGALVFLESAGRPEVVAGGDPEGAVGLGQILPGTAVSLLGMSVDLERSKELTRRIDRYRRRARVARTARRRQAASDRARSLSAERSSIDERFDPQRSLDGAARYLAFAEDRFGREDFAAVSYHMGIGNLEDVIDEYVSPRPPRRRTRDTVEDYELSYARIYFGSAPDRNPRTYRRLLAFGDDSRYYFFRLEASREIRRLYEDDRDELRRLAALHGAKASAEEVLRPRAEHPPYEDGDDLREGYEDGELLRLPVAPRRLGYSVDPRMGSAARRLEEAPELYRGLRPEALGTLLYIAKEVRRLSGSGGSLRVTSTVRDLPYQRLLIGTNEQATRGFSLHTTGFAVDIARDFRSRAQERALTFVLERLRALSVIDWVYEPGAIHLTAGPDAERFLPLVGALVPRP